MKTTFYIQFKATYKYGTDEIQGISAINMTLKPPTSPAGNLTVKFEVDIDEQIVLPTISASLAMTSVIDAIAGLEDIKKVLQ